MVRIHISALLLAVILLVISLGNAETGLWAKVPEDMKDRMRESREMRQRLKKEVSEKLDGREVQVRIYHNWEENRSVYEEVYIQLVGDTLNWDMVLDDGAVAVIVKTGQIDEIVKDVLGVRPILLRGPGQVSLCFQKSAGTKKIWRFRDGAGDPVSFANGEIFVINHYLDRVEPSPATSFTLNELGQCRWFYSNDSKNLYYYMIISHPDYGSHRFDVPEGHTINPWSAYEQYEYCLPIVPEASEAFERSVWGVVVDDANNPVIGASIKCWLLYINERIVESYRGWCEVFTDENGRFSLYLPTKDFDKTRLIPPNTQYDVTIKAPKELGLIPFVGKITNGTEHIIKLERAGYFHNFVFEDENGVVTDPKKLTRTHLEIYSPDKRRLDYNYGDFNDGGYFPLGTYRVRTNYGAKYEPLEVTEESPEELVFRVHRGIIYRGRVVHGITGEPMKGAFVIGVNSRVAGSNFSYLTREHWERLRELGSNFFVDKVELREMRRPIGREDGVWIFPDESDYPKEYIALKPLAGIYGFDRGARTNSDGNFEISFDRGEEFYGFVAFKENYLAIQVSKEGLVSEVGKKVEVPTIPLFPAATVKVEIELKDKSPFIQPLWVIDTNNIPEWAGKTHDMIQKEIEQRMKEQEEHYLQVIEQEQAWQGGSFDILSNPTIVFLSAFYELFVKDTVYFYGIPVKIHQNYSLTHPGLNGAFNSNDMNIGTSKMFVTEPGDDLLWLDELFDEPQDDPNRVPTFYEVFEGYLLTFEYDQDCPANRIHTVQVPANLNLNLKFYKDYNPELKWAPIFFAKTINLKQGEIFDLGTGEIKLAPQVFVKVVDSEGKPVEGAPVQHWFEGYGVVMRDNTNEDGIASFYARFNHKAKFIISGEGDDPNLKEEMSYEIHGEEDNGAEFTFRLSDVILNQVFK